MIVEYKDESLLSRIEEENDVRPIERVRLSPGEYAQAVREAWEKHYESEEFLLTDHNVKLEGDIDNSFKWKGIEIIEDESLIRPPTSE